MTATVITHAGYNYQNFSFTSTDMELRILRDGYLDDMKLWRSPMVPNDEDRDDHTSYNDEIVLLAKHAG